MSQDEIKICLKNHDYGLPIVNYLRLNVNYEAVTHDGYCSDPGEEEPEYSKKENRIILVPLNESDYTYFKEEMKNNEIPVELVEEKLDYDWLKHGDYCQYSNRIEILRATISELKIGYRELSRNCVAKLAILGYTTENSKNVFNPDYVLHRTTEAKVMDIIDCVTEENVTICPGKYKTSYYYQPNNTIKSGWSNSLEDLEEGKGLPYYKTFEQAKYMSVDLRIYTGEYKEWGSDGALTLERWYENGENIWEKIY